MRQENGEGRRGQAEIVKAVKQKLVGKEIRKKDDKEIELFKVPTCHSEFTFLV